MEDSDARSLWSSLIYITEQANGRYAVMQQHACTIIGTKFNSELHEYIKKAKMSNEKKTVEKSYPNTKFS